MRKIKLIVSIAIALLVSSNAFAQVNAGPKGPPKDHHGNFLNYSTFPPASDAEWKTQNLYSGYRMYHLIKRCYERREGFASVFINDTQYEKARLKAMNLEEDAKEATPDLDTDALWKSGVANAKGYFINFESCQNYFSAIFRLKSSRNVGPNTAATKDF